MKNGKVLITNYSITTYGNNGRNIIITIDNIDYSFTTSNCELADAANDKKHNLHKESLEYLIAQCLLHNQIVYTSYKLLK